MRQDINGDKLSQSKVEVWRAIAAGLARGTAILAVVRSSSLAIDARVGETVSLPGISQSRPNRQSHSFGHGQVARTTRAT